MHLRINQPQRQTSNLRHQPNMFKVSVFQPSPRSMHSHHKSKKTKTVIPDENFQSDYLHTLFLRKRRPASRHRTILGATQGACDATQPDSEKHIVKSVPAPGHSVVLPQSDACHTQQALPASQRFQPLLLGHLSWHRHTASAKQHYRKVSPASSTCTKGTKGEARTRKWR